MNMFNLNDPSINSEGSDVSIFPLGISENVTVESVTTDTSENGNQYIKFIFVAEDGSKVNMFEFEVTPKDGEEQSATLKRMDSQKKRIVHVLNKLLPEGSQLPAAQNWVELCNKIAAVCPAAILQGKTFRIKTVYSYNNYVSIPKYVPFLESMAVAKEDSRLKIDPKFDKMVKDEASTEAEIATYAAPEPKDDFPF